MVLLTLSPPCLPQRLGKREGKDNSVKMQCHTVYVAQLLRVGPVMAIHENVPQYDPRVLQPLTSKYDVHEAAVDAKNFGHPVSRPRVYRLLCKKGVTKWSIKDIVSLTRF